MRLEMLTLTRNSKLEGCDTLISRVRSTTVGTYSWGSRKTEALMDYYRMGVTRFLIRGFRPAEDMVEYGRDLFPMLRAAAEMEDRT